MTQSASTATLVRGRYVLVRVEHDGSTTLLNDAAVAIAEDGSIVEVAGYDDLRSRHPGADVIGDGSHFVLPGLVNAHHHGRGVSISNWGSLTARLRRG